MLYLFFNKNKFRLYCKTVLVLENILSICQFNAEQQDNIGVEKYILCTDSTLQLYYLDQIQPKPAIWSAAFGCFNKESRYI